MATVRLSRDNQRKVSPEREKMFMQAAKVSAENGRVRAIKEVRELTK